MDNEKLISKIFFEIQKDPSDYRAYEDVFSLCRSIEESDFKLAHDTNTELRSYISRGMKTSAYAKLFDLYRRSLLFDAPYKFDSYLLYIEINRKPEERFYQPRRRILKQVVDNLQKLVDDELDELFISMPPRVGKTTILMFFVTWLIGRNSESSNLYSAYSDISATGKSITFIEFGAGVHYAAEGHPKAGDFGFTRGGYGYHLGKLDSWRYSGNPGTNGEVITDGKHQGEVKTYVQRQHSLFEFQR